MDLDNLAPKPDGGPTMEEIHRARRILAEPDAAWAVSIMIRASRAEQDIPRREENTDG